MTQLSIDPLSAVLAAVLSGFNPQTAHSPAPVVVVVVVAIVVDRVVYPLCVQPLHHGPSFHLHFSGF